MSDYMDTPHYRVNKFAATLRGLGSMSDRLGRIHVVNDIPLTLDDLEAVVRQAAASTDYAEQLREALYLVAPYFYGEHHHDHPACVAVRAALAKNPNPAGSVRTEPSDAAPSGATEGSGPVGLGPSIVELQAGLDEALRDCAALIDERAALIAPAKELLYLYDWRPELAKIEKDPNADPKEVKRLLREYGERKKSGWIALRAALNREYEIVSVDPVRDAAVHLMESAMGVAPQRSPEENTLSDESLT